MKTKFEEHFYHDVLINEISIKNNADNVPILEFMLIDEKGQLFKCLFKNASQLFLTANFRCVGNVFIAQAFVSELDDSIAEYKRDQISFVSLEILEKIKCYIIQTTRGETIKILSEDDIIVSNMVNL
jgi:hypothetical protein